MHPRPYQIEALSSLWDYWRVFPGGSPLVVCPTGAGKSFIIALIIQKITEKYPNYRFIIATHVKEIVSQNAKALQALMPEEVIGIYSAGLGSKRIRRVTYAGIQSIYNKSNAECDMLIIDEAHMLSKDDSSRYQKFIKSLLNKNHKLKILGLTATPMRMDQGSLVAEGSTFTDIAYDIPIRDLIRDGYLSPLVSKARKSVDLTGVKTSGYDFNQMDLESAFNKEALIKEQLSEILEVAATRRSMLMFCAGINHAEQTCQQLKALGVSAEYVTGEMCTWERDLKIRDFKDGKVRALINIGVLTTGFDFGGIDCVVLLRATKSCSLYIQMVGRGTRTHPEKTDCLVLDYGGNIERHGPIDMITIKSKKGSKSEVVVTPHKKCPMCSCVVPTRTEVCPSCEYPFPDNTKELEIKATTKPILAEPEEYEVTNWDVKRHKKDGKPDSMKIEYFVGYKPYFDFLCFDHGGFAAREAQKKWWKRGGQMPAPKTVNEALERKFELFTPGTIKVIKRGKYMQVLDVFKAAEIVETEYVHF